MRLLRISAGCDGAGRVELDPTRMCGLLVGLPDVVVVGVVDVAGCPLRVHVEVPVERTGCSGCGTRAWVKDRPSVELVDLPAFGRPAPLVWRKHRWSCPEPDCGAGSWTGEHRAIAPARAAMTDRAGRWVTLQVGREGRTVADVARELGCDWHTINDAVMTYGVPLVDDPNRIGTVEALGLDETLFCRQGRWRRQRWCTSVVDVGRPAQLLESCSTFSRRATRRDLLATATPRWNPMSRITC